MVGYNATNRMSVIAGEAIAPTLRVKWDSTPGQVVIAGDEACIGIASNRALRAGDPITILDIKTVGTLPFTAAGVIDAGDFLTSAASGLVASGTGGSEDYGVAFSSTTGAGQFVEGSSAK